MVAVVTQTEGIDGSTLAFKGKIRSRAIRSSRFSPGVTAYR